MLLWFSGFLHKYIYFYFYHCSHFHVLKSIFLSINVNLSVCVCRFGAFELMLKYWTGPVTVVAYVTDEEILTLTKKLHRSEVIQNRSNIVYHVVYKRHVRMNLCIQYSGGSMISHRGRLPCRGRWLLRRLHFENCVCQNERIWTLWGRRPGKTPWSANEAI